ncbi:MAG: hypothetical protein AB7H97_09845 [Pseudobdellovibrionaceae bacterium]
MKKMLLGGLVIMFCAQAHALVTDQFSCKLKLRDFKTSTVSTSEKEFSVARLPLSASPAPDVRLTASEFNESLSMEVSHGSFDANVHLSFSMAVKLDEQGNPVEARQSSCLAVTGDYCKEQENHGCSSSSLACGFTGDPFDPVYGWSPTGLVDGLPVFDERELIPNTVMIRDSYTDEEVGLASVECRFKGTHQ